MARPTPHLPGMDPFKARYRWSRLVGRVVTLTVLVAVAQMLAAFPIPAAPAASTTFRLGFLLLASYLAGQIARGGALPAITGSLLVGVLVGPYVLNTLTLESVERLRVINEIALSLIAMSAGGELRVAAVRRAWKSISWITGSQLVLVFGLVAAVVFMSRNLFPFLQGHPARPALAVALIFGLVAVAKSPATTIAVITEERARGPLTETVLGITVIKDVLILVLIALVVPLAVVIARPELPFDLGAFEEISLIILLSLGAGVVVGFTISALLSRITRQKVLLVLAAAFLSVELAETMGLEYILLAMAAGFVVQNFSDEGPELIAALESNATPIFALFFALAGASVNLPALGAAWKIAAVLVIARFPALYLSTWLGARNAGGDLALRRRAWTGFVAQAGVSLGLAALVRDRFPELGPDMATIIIATVAVNQLLGPPMFRWALVKSGESHAAAVEEADVVASAIL